MPPSIRPRTSPSRDEARETTAPPLEKNTSAVSTVDPTSPATATPTTDTTANNNMLMSASSPLYSSGGLGMYGGGSMGMYGGMGMYGMPSPYYGVGGGPMSSLNQFLFSVQNVIFSLGQAVQIVGMNTQALHHLLDTATTMFDHALQTFQQMRTLDMLNEEQETEEEKKKRRRLRALRWALVMGVAYGGYRLIRRIVRKRTARPQLMMSPAQQPTAIQQPMYAAYDAGAPLSYGGAPMYGTYGSNYGGPYSYGGTYF